MMKRLTKSKGGKFGGFIESNGRERNYLPPERIGVLLDRLTELEDKLKDGQLKEIEYPCNIGDRVYVICSQTSNGKNLYIREGICDELRVAKNEAGGYWLWVAFKDRWSIFEWQFDRVFHTPEEAKARLKELQEKL